jgi:hypothetical protein
MRDKLMRDKAIRDKAIRDAQMRDAAMRDAAMRDAAMRDKRTFDQDELCSCLRVTTTCLEASTCENSVELLCNVASGRIFGGCEECVDHVNYRENYQSASGIIEKITALEDSLAQFVNTNVPFITDIDFEYSSSSVHVSVVLASNQDRTVALNNVVYYVSKALDVLPGAITYEFDNKRQETTVSARLIVVDEEDLAIDAMGLDSAGSGLTVGVMAVAALVLRFF